MPQSNEDDVRKADVTHADLLTVEFPAKLSVPDARITVMRLLHALEHAGDGIAISILMTHFKPGNAWDAKR